jgi:uncharacterized protein (TIGR03083 family)
MTTPSYAELVTAVRREGEGIVTAAGMGTAVTVPTCGDWTVEALLRHLSQVYSRVAGMVSVRATEGPPAEPAAPDGEPLTVMRGALDRLVAVLSGCGPDEPVWNWAPNQPDVASFWARRMAHESSVHRFDAQAAHGVMQPIDADLAGDGIDELIDVVAARVYARDSVTGPTGTVTLQSTDNDSWHLHLAPDGPVRADVVTSPDAVATGTSSALLLAAMSRIPWSSLEVSGRADLLDRWSGALCF